MDYPRRVFVSKLFFLERTNYKLTSINNDSADGVYRGTIMTSDCEQLYWAIHGNKVGTAHDH